MYNASGDRPLFTIAKLSAILLVLALIATTFPRVTPAAPEQAHFDWADEFRYASLTDFKNADWIVLGFNDLISFPGNGIQIDNDGSRGVTIMRSGFPVSIHDWKAGTQGYWLGRQYGSIAFGVKTTTHTYAWAGDGFYPEYVLYRDGVKVLRFGGYTPERNVAERFEMEKRGNVILLYFNDKLVNTYNEVDASGELGSIYISSGWISTTLYDYISITGIAGQVNETTASSAAPGQLVTVTLSVTGATSTFAQVVQVISQSDVWVEIGALAGVVSSILVAMQILLSRRKRKKSKHLPKVNDSKSIPLR